MAVHLGGTFNCYVQATGQSADLTVNGGTFTKMVTFGSGLSNPTSDDGTLNITNGTFSSGITIQSKGTETISGGTISGGITKSDIGSLTIENIITSTNLNLNSGSGTVTIKNATVGTISSRNYGSDKCLVIENSTVNGVLTFNANGGTGTLSVTNSIIGTGSSKIYIASGATATISSSTVKGYISVNGNSSVETNVSITGSTVTSYVENQAGSGKVTITNSQVNGIVRAYNTYSGYAPTVEISSGTYAGEIKVGTNGTINISGGTFNGTLTQGTSNSTLSITGGTFKNNPSSYVDSSNYTVISNSDGTYTVTAGSTSD